MNRRFGAPLSRKPPNSLAHILDLTSAPSENTTQSPSRRTHAVTGRCPCNRSACVLLNDYELPHHAQVFMIENVAVEHIRSVFSGISIKAGGDDDLAVRVHPHGVLPT